MNEDQDERFVNAVEEDYAVVQEALEAIDVRNITSPEEGIADMILNEINKMPGGFKRANAFIVQRLEAWVVSAAQRAVAERGDMAGQLAFNVAGLLEAQGDLSAARALWEQIVPARAEKDGDTHELTLAAKGNYAIVMHSQGDWEGARDMYRLVVEGKTAVRGPHHPSTLRSRSNLASVKYCSGDISGAVDEFRAVVEGFDLSEKSGAVDVHTARRRSSVARLDLANAIVGESEGLQQEDAALALDEARALYEALTELDGQEEETQEAAQRGLEQCQLALASYRDKD